MWNQLKTILLFGALSALLIGIGGAIAPDALMLFVALALAMNLGAYFYSHKIVLAMYRAKELHERQAPELFAMVRGLSQTAGIPMPRLFLIADEQPNAFATGRNPEHGIVAVTAGLLDVLDRREVRGVLAHELAHIANRDILVSTVAAILASVITTLAHVLSFGTLFGGASRDEEHGSLIGGLLTLLIAPIAATLLQLAISRSRELHADETGARISGDPDGLAGALIKLDQTSREIPAEYLEPSTANLMIINPFGALHTMSRWFSTHPSTAERVQRLRQLGSRPSRVALHAQSW